MHYRGDSTPILCVRVVGARGRGGHGGKEFNSMRGKMI